MVAAVSRSVGRSHTPHSPLPLSPTPCPWAPHCRRRRTACGRCTATCCASPRRCTPRPVSSTTWCRAWPARATAPRSSAAVRRVLSCAVCAALWGGRKGGKTQCGAVAPAVAATIALTAADVWLGSLLSAIVAGAINSIIGEASGKKYEPVLAAKASGKALLKESFFIIPNPKEKLTENSAESTPALDLL